MHLLFGALPTDTKAFRSSTTMSLRDEVDARFLTPGVRLTPRKTFDLSRAAFNFFLILLSALAAVSPALELIADHPIRAENHGSERP
jgi:hypothetical protein